MCLLERANAHPFANVDLPDLHQDSNVLASNALTQGESSWKENDMSLKLGLERVHWDCSAWKPDEVLFDVPNTKFIQGLEDHGIRNYTYKPLLPFSSIAFSIIKVLYLHPNVSRLLD